MGLVSIGMEGRGMTLMRSSMVLPSTLCILVLVFVQLLALEVHVEAAQQFAGPSQRTLGVPPSVT